MRATNWSAATSDRAAALRAGGRRRYNAERRATRDHRRALLVQLVLRYRGWGFAYRNGAALAAHLGVSRATICRDLAALMRCD